MPVAAVYITKCPQCKTDVHEAYKDCLGCGRFIDYPNVRASKAPAEVSALGARVGLAQADAALRNTLTELAAFEKAAKRSHVVIARSFAALHTLLSQDNAMIASYYKQVSSGCRVAGTSAFDKHRLANDSTINPYCSMELNFAALSLNHLGISWYGEYFLTLKDVMIRNRSNVFEENPTIFCKTHKLAGLKPVPKGRRAPYSQRHSLAVAKLHNRIQPKMKKSEFASLLITEKKGGKDDFIEVQTYGPIAASAISRITGPIPAAKYLPLWDDMRQKMDDLGIQFESRP